VAAFVTADGTPAPADSASVDSAGPAPAASDSALREGTAEPGEVEEGAADTTAARRRRPEPVTGFDRPRWVMLRSLLVPGWGQAHNRSWVKAGLVAASELYLGYRIWDDRRELDRLDAAVIAAQELGDPDLEDQLITRYNTRLDQYVGRQWLLGGLLAYALLDAYIDAHFRSFRLQFEEDPALPPGERPAAGFRLFWQERF
jgi:hypothetical protein